MNRYLKSIWRIVKEVCCIFIIVFSFFILINNRKEKIEYPIDYIKESELKYWECKSELVTEVQNYIDYIAPTSNLRGFNLVEASEKYQIDIKFMLAQGQIESHFGTKGLARQTNSVWNVLAFDSLSYKEISKKGKYQHPNMSIEPYCELLKEKYLVNKSEHDLMIRFVNVHGKRYATDPNYEISLSNQYNTIKSTTKIDSLQDLLLYYKIRALR